MKNDPKAAAKTLTPLAAHPAHPMSKIERTRKAVQADQAEQQMSEGMVRIEALHGLDIVPNAISSTPPEPITIRPQECWVNRDYQRNLSRKSMKLIHDIVTNWDWTIFKPPVVTKDEQGRFIIIDGQHTTIGAATHPGIEKIPAMFIPLQSIQHQAEAFIGHNTARIPVANLDLFHARIEAGDETAVTANKVMNEMGISVVRSVQGRGHVWQSNQTMATQVVMSILSKHGLPKFHSVVEFISQCGFSPIRADHWRFAEALLTGPERIYTPSLMLKIIQSTNDADAMSEATKIARSMDLSVYRGLLVYYKNRYKEVHRVR